MLLRILSVAILSVMTSALAVVADPVDPAQAIAQKFSEAGDAKPDAKPTAQPPSATAPASTKPVAAKQAATNPAATAERPSLDYEMDMLRRARAEDPERESQHAKDAQNANKETAAAPKPVETVTAPAAAEVAPSAAVLMPPPLAAAPMTAMPLPEAVAPSAIAPSAKSAESTASPPPQSAPAQPSPAALTAAELPGIAGSDASGAPHATVLLVLDTDDAAPAKPDPIICLSDCCWISNGIEAPAKPLPRSEAVALKSTDSPTMDSCSGKSACVFRDIPVATDARIEIIELGDGHGATTGAYSVMADASCRKDDNALVCDNALVTHDFRIWMVPEATAQAIGAEGLEDAVAAGLPNDGAEPANDK